MNKTEKNLTNHRKHIIIKAKSKKILQGAYRDMGRMNLLKASWYGKVGETVGDGRGKVRESSV